MAHTKEFQQAYEMLNPEQRRAVDTIEGPVMVVAGPGTGKTQILTLRIANILLQTDTEPENILALTFTEAAAANMRKRLTRLIGSAAHEVVISTFHSFANDIIQKNPDDFPLIIGSQPMTEVDQVRIVQDIVLKTELKYLKPFGDTFYYVRSIIAGINQLKREGVNLDLFAEIVEKEEKNFSDIEDLYHDKGAHAGKMKGKYQLLEKKINKNKELIDIYRQYQEVLASERRYDFSDMIMEAVRALGQNEELLLRLQETHQYILVDEHQDTNNAQNKLLGLLANFHEAPNLFVVGDEKQSIFRFQGASLENFYYFKYQYAGAQLISLVQNYRSTQSILDSAHSLITTETALSANVDHEQKLIDIVSYQQLQDELSGVVGQIQSLLDDGVAAEEIAVLYRNNRDAMAVSDALRRHGIQHAVESDQDLFSDPIAMRFFTLLRAVADFGSDESLAKALHLDIAEIDHLDVFNVVRTASQKRKYSLYDCLKNPKKHLKDIELYQPERLNAFYANIESWVGLSQNEHLLSVVEAIIHQSGLLQSVMSDAWHSDGLVTLNTLFDEVRDFASRKSEASLKDFMSHIDMMREHGLRIKRFAPGGLPGSVRLMTAHKSKGLEFEYVFIIHAYDGNWGNKMKRDPLPLLDGVFTLFADDAKQELGELSGGEMDDERRLFYVAITRAKKHVVITYSEHGVDGRALVRSRFIDEIHDELVNVFEGESALTSLQPAEDVTDTQEEMRARIEEFVRTAFSKRGLSVSALNNYLKSPWQYFFRNLVRIPAAPNKFQAYGTAVHAALNDLFEALRIGEEFGKDQLLARFEYHLGLAHYMSESEYNDALDKGYRALEAWYQEYAQVWQIQTLNEFHINGVLLSDEVRLTGVLDKIEFIDGTDSVNVVDYKTGKRRTRNDLMGKTKGSTGDYYRQLVFYKLLLDNFKEGKYRMVSGEIDFVEPDDQGRLYKEKFDITDAEVDELKDTIMRVTDEILNLKFWGAPCDPKVCDYCDLVEMLK